MINKMSYEELEKALEESNKLCSKMNMKYINEKNKNDKAREYINKCIFDMEITGNANLSLNKLLDILKGEDK